MSILSITLRTHVHATEDRGRVLEALLNILPPAFRDNARIEREVYEGHYGNVIEVLSLELQDPQLSSTVFTHILSSLQEPDRRILFSTLEDRVSSDGSLYIRLDKQNAYRGVLELSDGDDVVRIEVRIKGGKREALRFLREVLSSSGASQTSA